MHSFQILFAHTLSDEQIVRICHNGHCKVICDVPLEVEWILLEDLRNNKLALRFVS